jgi:hypothetical protein
MWHPKYWLTSIKKERVLKKWVVVRIFFEYKEEKPHESCFILHAIIKHKRSKDLLLVGGECLFDNGCLFWVKW